MMSNQGKWAQRKKEKRNEEQLGKMGTKEEGEGK